MKKVQKGSFPGGPRCGWKRSRKENLLILERFQVSLGGNKEYLFIFLNFTPCKKIIMFQNITDLWQKSGFDTKRLEFDFRISYAPLFFYKIQAKSHFFVFLTYQQPFLSTSKFFSRVIESNKNLRRLFPARQKKPRHSTDDGNETLSELSYDEQKTVYACIGMLNVFHSKETCESWEWRKKAETDPGNKKQQYYNFGTHQKAAIFNKLRIM